jgi:hypothetical protein
MQVYGRQLTALTVGAKLYYQGERSNVDPTHVKAIPKVSRGPPATECDIGVEGRAVLKPSCHSSHVVSLCHVAVS